MASSGIGDSLLGAAGRMVAKAKAKKAEQVDQAIAFDVMDAQRAGSSNDVD